MTDRLVPAFNQCGGSSPAGMTHGPPIAVPSCSPPVETSSFLTANAPDRAAPYAGVAGFYGNVTEAVVCLIPGTTTQMTSSNPPCNAAGDQEDVKVTVDIGGVNCVTVSGGCSAGGALYNGKVLLNKTLRISDHYNQIIPNPTGADCSDTASCVATAIDFPATWGIQCTAGNCGVTTSFDLVVPGLIPEQKRTVIAEGTVTVQDAGGDGDLAGGAACPPMCAQNGADHNVFAVEGVFAP
jgi:hypothetical protein